MEKTEFTLKYDGPALENHEMDVKDLAPALLSLGELLEEANRVFNGDKIKLAVKIKATQEGSVDVLLSVAQDILGQAVSLFSGTSISSIVNAYGILQIIGIANSKDGGLFGLIKWTKGRNIKSIIRLESGDLKLELDKNGEVQVYNENSVKLFGLYEVRRKTEALIKTPLLKEGVDKVGFYISDTEKQEIKKDEAEYFSAPEIQEEIIDDREIEINLQIVNISFQEDGKWKFNDGNTTFFAEITDKDFLGKVQQNQAFFAKDDILTVILKRKQLLSNGVLKTEYSVNKILNHRSAAVQIQLPFLDQEK